MKHRNKVIKTLGLLIAFCYRSHHLWETFQNTDQNELAIAALFFTLAVYLKKAWNYIKNQKELKHEKTRSKKQTQKK